MQDNRTWFTIKFYRENSPDSSIQQKMLAIPGYGDYIQFSKEVSTDIFQVVDNPKHTIGKSPNNNPYHYISVTIREFIPSLEDTETEKKEIDSEKDGYPPDTSLEN